MDERKILLKAYEALGETDIPEYLLLLREIEDTIREPSLRQRMTNDIENLYSMDATYQRDVRQLSYTQWLDSLSDFEFMCTYVRVKQAENNHYNG